MTRFALRMMHENPKVKYEALMLLCAILGEIKDQRQKHVFISTFNLISQVLQVVKFESSHKLLPLELEIIEKCLLWFVDPAAYDPEDESITGGL